MALGILHLRLWTHRLSELQSFYSEKLHFPIREETGDAITFQAGTTALTFVQAAELEGQPFYHFAFNIPENKLPLAQEWLTQRTPLATHGTEVVFPYPHWNAEAIYFWDPAGNLGELIARHDLPNAHGGPFTPEDILYGSEIGLVVDDVPAAVQLLKASLALPTYRTGSPVFEPLGDAHRLLLVAAKGRPWMERPSQVFPTEVTLQGPEPARCVLPGYPYTIEIRPR
jgi:catechol-2,3-dioxygenase